MQVTNNDNSINHRRFIPVSKWPDYHSWPPIGGLRHLIFNAKVNGFNACIVRAGRRVLIDEQSFLNWLEMTSPQ